MSARPTSRRVRASLRALWGTLLGLTLVTALALAIQRNRDAALADPEGSVTAGFKRSTIAGAPALTFRDVSAELGLVFHHGPGERGRTLPEDTGSGLAWADVDLDGDLDLYLVNFAGPLGAPPDPAGTNRLFVQDGGRFVDATDQAGVADLEGFGMGASFADYDGDGDPDLYVTNRGPNRLFQNRGDGTFEEVGESAGVADPLWSTGAAWGDFDRDGDLDLYVCNYVRYEDGGLGPETVVSMAAGAWGVPFTLNPNAFDPEPNRLYVNRGDGTFEERATELGVRDAGGRSLAASFCDLDGDGWLDLYVNNDVSMNRLYLNLGERADLRRRFLDASASTGTADPRGSMGLSIAELELPGGPDGLPDLFVTHWVAQENALYQSWRTPSGRLEYRDKTRALGLAEISLDTVGWGSALVDLDLDGRLDIAVANGSTLEDGGTPPRLLAEAAFLFWNDGERFHDLAPMAGEALASLHRARGLAAADFDADGDVDLALSINRGDALLLRNETTTSNRSLVVRLAGPDAARLGARVELEAGGRLQVQWLGADVGYLGMHAPELCFGLGALSGAERLSVRWADGAASELRKISAGRVEVVHPQRGAVAPR